MEKIIQAVEYDYINRNKAINELCNKYHFLRKKVIGKSVMGKDILSLKLGSSESPSVIAAAFHGSERITSNILLMLIENICENAVNDGYMCGIKLRTLLENKSVIFIPCVNPDGCDISLLGEKALGNNKDYYKRITKNDFTNWNANARGIDINHNFNAEWGKLKELEKKNGIHFPAPGRFGGYAPESEPETIALTNLCKNQKIKDVTALHTQGEVIYWSFNDISVPRALKKAQILATSSSYELDEADGIASGGGFKDWFISEFKRPGFTIELGKGKNPLPITDCTSIYQKAEKMLLMSAFY